jgi:hypothetical protein
MPVSLPAHGACPDPPLLLGPQGMPSAQAILGGLRELQATLGILEERGGNGLTPGAGDAEAASALLADRASAKLAVGVVLSALAAVLAALDLARRLPPLAALLALGAIPIAGGGAMAALIWLTPGAPLAVRLVTVDARAGAPVALVRTVEAAWKPHAADARDGAWLVRADPPRRADEVPHTVEIWDVVDVPGELAVAPAPGEPAALVMRGPSSEEAPRAFACGSEPEAPALAGGAAQRAQGKLLLERCRHQRGALAPLVDAWLPQVRRSFGELPAAAAQGAWLYLLPGREDRP